MSLIMSTIRIRTIVLGLTVWLSILPLTVSANEKQRFFEFHGQVLDSEGRLIHSQPHVFLHGGTHPYNSHTQAGLDGRFKFRNLLPGSYVLIVAVPGEGEMKRTIEVGPTLADKKGRVRDVIRFTASAQPDDRELIHSSQLKIPKQARQELQRGLDCLGKNDIAGARKHFEAAVELAPHYSNAWNQLGVLAYQTAEYATAERHFRRALKEDPSSYPPLVNLGGALLALGKHEEALKINERAVRRAPEDALAHSQLGMSYVQARDFAKAELHLRQAIALDPGHFSAPQLVLADLYLIQGRLKERTNELEEYLKYHPDGRFAPQVRTMLEAAKNELEVSRP